MNYGANWKTSNSDVKTRVVESVVVNSSNIPT